MGFEETVHVRCSQSEISTCMGIAEPVLKWLVWAPVTVLAAAAETSMLAAEPAQVTE